MARNEMFVTVYRLEVEATRENLGSMENFIEAISDGTIVSNDEGPCSYHSSVFGCLRDNEIG